jgi:hypothetical protein
MTLPAVEPTQRALPPTLGASQRASALPSQSSPAQAPFAKKPTTLAISRKTIAATTAGFLGGLVATALLSLLNVRLGPYSQVALALLVGSIVGACIPGAINAVPGLLSGQPRRSLRDAGAAAAISAAVMVLVSLGLARVVPRETIFFQGNFVLGLLAWLLFGLALGVVEGLLWRSAKRALLGATGGAIGAILAFVIGTLLDNEGAFLWVGPLVGLGANLLPDLLKTAWVEVVNLDRRFDVNLDKPVVIFGSSDDPRHADVGLYGDRGISPRHFAIEHHGNRYILAPLPQTTPVLVNGAAVTQATQLRQGDLIAVGRARIRFSMKN